MVPREWQCALLPDFRRVGRIDEVTEESRIEFSSRIDLIGEDAVMFDKADCFFTL